MRGGIERGNKVVVLDHTLRFREGCGFIVRARVSRRSRS
jgi:hypothetical protein